jgi:hypothetical protein
MFTEIYADHSWFKLDVMKVAAFMWKMELGFSDEIYIKKFIHVLKFF